MSSCDPFEWRRAVKEKNWRCEPRDEEEAKRVQREVTKVAEDLWGPVVGWKVALTGKSRELFGGGPITGPLFRDGILGNGSTVEIIKLSDPLLEPELFYCEGSYFLAFEIPDNRYGKKWRELNWLMLLADLAGSYKVAVGKEVEPEEGAEVVVRGPGAEVKGALSLEKVRSNSKLVEDKEGCKLLGTVLDPIKPEVGEYVFSCCGKEVRVRFV
ncbi:MAG: hypothetical protein GXO07_05545 [Crenarchaeota archaeon]|nr:hypothetical protein [Thermoproteota archaeon]